MENEAALGAPGRARRPRDQTEAQSSDRRRMVCLESGGARQRVAVPLRAPRRCRMLKSVTMHHGDTKRVHLGGWRKQPADLRDEEFRLKLHPSFLTSALPPTGDLRGFCSP